MNKLIIFFLLELVLISHSKAQAEYSLKIPREKPQMVNLSEITENAEYIVLKIPSENELFHISDVSFAADKIFITDSNDPDEPFPKRLSIFESNGTFIKHVGPAKKIAVDRLKGRIYSQFNTNTITVYTLMGDSIRSFQTNYGFENIHFFDGNLYLSSSKYLQNGVYEYGLFQINPTTEKQALIHQFKIEDVETSNKIGAYSRLWSDDKLYWTYGLKDHVYEIDKDNNFKKVPIGFDFDRPYFDQVLTHYGVFGNNFYCSYSINVNSTIAIKNFDNEEVRTVNKHINDDIFNTGVFILISSLSHNYLVFNKDMSDLSDNLKKKYKMTNADRLLIYAY